jgi:hypothetical protein
VSRAPAGPPRATLGLLGLGATLIGVALALRPVHLASIVFWLVLAAGGLCLAIAIVLRLFVVGSGTETQRKASRRLVGAECWRVYEALVEFLDERSREHPQSNDAAANGDRNDKWRQTTTHRYREEFSVWAPQVFEAAVAWAAVSPTSRRLVEAPAAAQISVVRDLFRDAALTLEHD